MASEGFHPTHQSMIERFQIEDLISQDLSGVVFRALDTQSGKSVAVRRFFPFGADGDGLNTEEQASYEIALGRLAGLNHPALRSVISGACDPVDHMPFIVTEWIEGESLAACMAGNVLSTESAILLITQALEVSELFSQVLAEEAIWVETNLQTIIVGGPESDRGFTFWISPLKWLGGSEETRGLEAIAILGEQVLGWTGRIFTDQAGGGLGGWLKWLRKNAATTTLQEARTALAALTAASTAAGPPQTTALVVTQASKLPKAHSKTSLVVATVLGLLVAGLAIFFVVKPDAPTDGANQLVTLQWNDHEALVLNKSKQVSVEGTAESIVMSQKGKTIYLLFANEEDKNAARAAIRIGESSIEALKSELQPFVGKKIRVTGKITVLQEIRDPDKLVVHKLPDLNRPDIMMKDVSAVEIIE